jgi:hypothetical protein
LDKVIGLGKLGCAIAEELTAYPEYRIYKIDADIDERGSLSIGDHGTMGSYESEIDTEEIEIYLRSIKKKDKVLMVLEGGDPITGAALKILQTVNHATLNVLYIAPDRQMISATQKRDDKIAFSVLQEYARSGVFANIFLVNKPQIEELAGEVPIDKYEQTLSYFVAYVVAMINFFNHTEPILANKITPKNIARIATYGVSSLDQDNQGVNLLFPLSSATDIHFFYGVPKEDLTEDSSLVKRIKQHVKDHKTEEVSSSFSVYETTLDSLIVLVVAYSSKIQQSVSG